MGLLIIFHEDGTIEEYPWETKLWRYESPAVIPGSDSLIGMNMSFPTSASILKSRNQRKRLAGFSAALCLDVMDVGPPVTFSDVGPTYPLANALWAVSSVYIPQTNQLYLYEAPTVGAMLMTWDVKTGISTEYGELEMDPLNWLGYLYP
ncbi:hypothetical protein Pelo_19417 [Pelomyxa schiedti]|nr:hypothetical protein Pelo_19417 [Pelomyxa schiedti]